MKRAPKRPIRTASLLTLAALICALACFSACRAGVYDPDKIVHPAPPTDFPFDTFQDARAPGGNGELVAGVGVVDISPYNYRVWISGFGAGNISRGVRDPIYARALFVDDGRESIVLVSLDLTGLLLPDVNRIRARVTERYPERIIIGATHNHLAPDTIGYWGYGPAIPLETGVVEDYQNEMLAGVADAINEAVMSARPARIQFGSVTIPEGWSSNMWFPDDPTAKDNEMTVLRVTGESGEAIATMVNWPCHAEAMLGKGGKISAEFPGQFYTAVAERGGGEGIFFQGALGGMVSPYVARWDMRKVYDFDDRLAFNRKLGRLLAEKADEAVAESPELEGRDLSIRVIRQEIVVPVESRLFELAGRLSILRDPDRAQLVGDAITVTSEVNVIGFGPATMVTVPGEIFPAIGATLKRNMHVPYRFVLGLTSDELAYMMTPEQYRDDTYHYERETSLGPQTGPIVEKAALDLLRRYDMIRRYQRQVEGR